MQQHLAVTPRAIHPERNTDNGRLPLAGAVPGEGQAALALPSRKPDSEGPSSWSYTPTEVTSQMRLSANARTSTAFVSDSRRRQRSSVAELVLGSHAQDVILNATCPVLSVRPVQ